MKKILVGVDGSPREAGVLGASVALARKLGAKVFLVRAVGIPYELPAKAMTVSPQEVVAILERGGQEALEGLSQRVPPELLGGMRTLVGNPWQAIEQAAREENVDLIVVGSHGYGGLDRVLGTTAAKVVNHADRAVMVVRAPERLTSG